MHFVFAFIRNNKIIMYISFDISICGGYRQCWRWDGMKLYIQFIPIQFATIKAVVSTNRRHITLSCRCNCLELPKNACRSVQEFSGPVGSEIGRICQ